MSPESRIRDFAFFTLHVLLNSHLRYFAIVEVVAILLGIWFIPNDQVSAAWAITALIVAVNVPVVFVPVAWVAYNRSQGILPVVRRVISSPLPGAKNQGSIERMLLLLSPSPLFVRDSYVEVYIYKDDYEQLASVGYVTSIQTNGMIQVRLLATADAHAPDFENCDSWGKERWRALIVKPTVSRFGSGLIDAAEMSR